MSQSIDIQEEINKTLNLLDTEENDVEKISKAAHRSLLLMLVRDAVMEMREEKKENEKNEENGEEKMKLFHEKIQKSYLEKVNFLRRQLLN